MQPNIGLQEARPRDIESLESKRTIVTYFHQDCAACGRQLGVRLEFLGQQLICQHCGRGLLAADPIHAGTTREDPAPALHRANQLLARSSRFFTSREGKYR